MAEQRMGMGVGMDECCWVEDVEMGVGMVWLSVGAGVGVCMGEELARAWAWVWQVWLDEGMGVSMV